MRKISVLSTGLLALAALTIVSCKKQVAAEVEGDWQRVAVATAGPDSENSIWHFKNNGTLIIENTTNPLHSDSGSYVVVEKSLKNYVRIDKLNGNAGGAEENGDWKVVQYKKDILILAKPDVSHTTGEDIGTIVREFTRL